MKNLLRQVFLFVAFTATCASAWCQTDLFSSVEKGKALEPATKVAKIAGNGGAVSYSEHSAKGLIYRASTDKERDSIAKIAPSLDATVTRPQAGAKDDVSAENAETGKMQNPVHSPRPIDGGYVMNYKTFSRTFWEFNFGKDGGNSVDVEYDSQTNQMRINNFYDVGWSVVADVDWSSNRFTIPTQVIGLEKSTGNEVIISGATLDDSKVPYFVSDTTIVVTGTMRDDGNMSIDGRWGIFYKDGSGIFNCIAECLLQRANGKISTRLAYPTGGTVEYKDTTYHVVVSQRGLENLEVLNFGNHGQNVIMELHRDRTAHLYEQQTACAFGNWYDEKIQYFAAKATSFAINESSIDIDGFNIDLVSEPVEQNGTIAFTDWIELSADARHYISFNISTELETELAITMPEPIKTEWEGDGSEQNPYRIKTPDDLLLLAERASTIEKGDYVDPGNILHKYAGTWFRLENDIDLAGHSFTPIGRGYYYRFSGNFDGNNHTIKNMDIRMGSEAYTGMFGALDEVARVYDLSLDCATVRSQGSYTGILAGGSVSEFVDNVHVTNSSVEAIGDDMLLTVQYVGGILGLTSHLTNSSITDSRVVCRGSLAGGITGLVHSAVSDCCAENVTVSVSSPQNELGNIDSYGGGAIGYVDAYTTVDNCYFVGNVINGELGSYTQQILTGAQATVGGFTGVIAPFAHVDNCFSIIDDDYRYNVNGFDNNTRRSKVSASFCPVIAGSLSNAYAIGGLAGVAFSPYDGMTNIYFVPSLTNCYAVGSRLVQPDVVFLKYIGGTDPNDGKDSLTFVLAEQSNVYYDSQVSLQMSQMTNRGYSTKKLTRSSGPRGFGTEQWIFREGFYPILRRFENNAYALAASTALFAIDDETFGALTEPVAINRDPNVTEVGILNNGTVGSVGKYFQINGETLDFTGKGLGIDTLVLSCNDVRWHYLLTSNKEAEIPLVGDGTELSPYLISCKQDIVVLYEVIHKNGPKLEGVHFLMTNDIDMENDTTVMTYGGNAFAGIFDGGDHFIHNWPAGGVRRSHEGKGFFYSIGPNGVLKNLNIASDCKIASNVYNVGSTYFLVSMGSFAQYLTGGTIDNCNNYADVIKSDEPNLNIGYMGGIVGSAYSGRIANCNNYGKVINLKESAGGIAGYLSCLIEGSSNYGQVVANSHAAGIAACLTYATGSYAGTESGMSHCSNYGEIQSLNNTAAGIVAVDDYDHNTYLCNDCANYGNVKALLDAGGIVAYFPLGTNSRSRTFHNLLNTGNIVSEEGYAGGIMGFGIGMDLKNCVNLGDIQSLSDNLGAGGIAGSGADYFENCVNSGNVSGGDSVAIGGIVGTPINWTYHQTALKDCYNVGALTSTNPYHVGNIVGNLDSTYWGASNSITNCRYVTDFGYAENDSLGTPVSLAELCALGMHTPNDQMLSASNDADSWENYDEYSLPMPTTLAMIDDVKVAAAQVVLADGDTRERVSRPFNVGLPEGVEWSVDVEKIVITGNDGSIEAPFSGEVNLTATCGDAKKTITLNVVDGSSSISDANVNGKDVVSEQWFALDGMKTPKSQLAKGQVYIQVLRYSDGTMQAIKVVW
ncbi:MAG: hypothetical protein J5980_11040 [Muribaculaceae bacterium]|nr:hypothetical protein [Muribaculaceae bacterium]